LRAAYSEFDGGAVVNIAGGARTTLNQIIALLNEFTQQNLPTQFGPPRAGDVLHSHADISRARELLGYAPSVDVREGLRRTLEWYEGQRK
jgi:nucleoside-diphosphate-sugar epimerase